MVYVAQIHVDMGDAFFCKFSVAPPPLFRDFAKIKKTVSTDISIISSM